MPSIDFNRNSMCGTNGLLLARDAHGVLWQSLACFGHFMGAFSPLDTGPCQAGKCLAWVFRGESFPIVSQCQQELTVKPRQSLGVGCHLAAQVMWKLGFRMFSPWLALTWEGQRRARPASTFSWVSTSCFRPDLRENATPDFFQDLLRTRARVHRDSHRRMVDQHELRSRLLWTTWARIIWNILESRL